MKDIQEKKYKLELMIPKLAMARARLGFIIVGRAAHQKIKRNKASPPSGFSLANWVLMDGTQYATTPAKLKMREMDRADKTHFRAEVFA